jgi:hypothetical protein
VAITITFGKHKGRLITDVPADYLNWMEENRTKQWEDAVAELARRSGNIQGDTPLGFSIHPDCYDMVSLCLRPHWINDGVHTWIVRTVEEALALEGLDDDWTLTRKNFKFTFTSQLDLISIHPTEESLHA